MIATLQEVSIKNIYVFIDGYILYVFIGVCICESKKRIERDSGSFAAILFMYWFADNGNGAR